MSIFVDYLSNPFSNLSNTPQIIIMTSTNSLWIQSLIVTNTGEEDIRINLKFMRNIIDPLGNVGIFLAKNFLIPSYKTISSQKEPVLYNTVDLVKVLSIPMNLQYTSNITESLTIYSNGYTQIFDCSVIYSRLNELPMNS
jgi:hypothetical protein